MKTNLIINSKGFSQILLLNLFIIFISIYFLASVSYGLLHIRSIIRKQCYQKSYQTIATNLENTRTLFSLNPLSKALKTAIKTTEAAIAINLAAMNFSVIPTLEQQLQLLKQEQIQLDIMQKSLILKNQIQLSKSHIELQSTLLKEIEKEKQLWSFLFTMFYNLNHQINFHYPIRPDSENQIAPSYEWEKNAEQYLTLAFNWQFKFFTIDNFQKLFKEQNKFEINCGFKPNLKGEKWELKIIKDKSY